MLQNKQQLSTLLNSIGVPVSEGESEMDSVGTGTKIVYWEYSWADSMASGDDYHTVVTYQISLVSDTPRCEALVDLKHELNLSGEHPRFSIEYVKGVNSPGYFHSYCAIDILEDI